MPGFGERLRKARVDTGWTQDQLARAADTKPVNIRNWEARETDPQSPNLRRLALALDVSADVLLGISAAPNGAAGGLRRARRAPRDPDEAREHVRRVLESLEQPRPAKAVRSRRRGGDHR